ncbi:hypothetical protein ONA70_12785 [Micromonospora yasonensis]|uniref:hypothetical protein n=1 Tax=Micromonospora yasonensis TaxID=1128667 RepID=UPI0022308F50|nr:hypothetical protein [Micromonospora yasonensis]MCW3840975.1 hypothetical protein [Micromonospora yasonensis]
MPSADLRVRLSSPGGQQTHPNPAANRSASRGPEWTGTIAGQWPALPGDTVASGPDATPGEAGGPRRDPWPALPDDRELWQPAAGATDAAHLHRLDREQAGE